jgi:hypothetical protein
MLSSSGHEFGLLPYTFIMGLAVCQVQWVKSLEIIISFLLSRKAQFAYFYDF